MKQSAFPPPCNGFRGFAVILTVNQVSRFNLQNVFYVFSAEISVFVIGCRFLKVKIPFVFAPKTDIEKHTWLVVKNTRHLF